MWEIQTTNAKWFGAMCVWRIEYLCQYWLISSRKSIDIIVVRNSFGRSMLVYLFFRLIRFCVFKLDWNTAWADAHWSFRVVTILPNTRAIEMRHVPFLLLCINNKWNEPCSALNQTAFCVRQIGLRWAKLKCKRVKQMLRNKMISGFLTNKWNLNSYRC